jgi:hypothetical protein
MIAPFLALVGCHKAVDAPANLEALMVYGFVNYNEDDAYLVATEDGLIPEVKKHLDEMGDGYKVDNLTSDDLMAAGVEDPPDLTDIIGAMGTVDYTHDLDDVVDAVSNEHKDEMFDNFLEYEVLDTTDRKCFLAHECDRLDQKVHEKTHVDFIGDADRTYTNSYRWIDDPDLPAGVVIQQLNPTQVDFEGSMINVTVYQQYEFVVMWDNGKHTTRRADAFWVDFEVAGMEVSDNFAVNNAVGQMGKQAENIDAWLDDNP